MPSLRSWTDEQLVVGIKRSYRVRAVIKELGLILAGGNYTQIQQRMYALKPDTAHFTGVKWNKGKKYHISTRPELEPPLVVDSSMQSFKPKQRLYGTGSKKAQCELCSWAEKASGGRIPVELDHINGDHYDNRLENLRILCPNCHSLQSTYRGKNKKVKLRYARVV